MFLSIRANPNPVILTSTQEIPCKHLGKPVRTAAFLLLNTNLACFFWCVLTFYRMVSPHLLHPAVPTQQWLEKRTENSQAKHIQGFGQLRKNKGTGSVLSEAVALWQSSSCSQATCMWTLGVRSPPTVAHTPPNNYGWGPKVNCLASFVELIGEVEMERSQCT